MIFQKSKATNVIAIFVLTTALLGSFFASQSIITGLGFDNVIYFQLACPVIALLLGFLISFVSKIFKNEPDKDISFFMECISVFLIIAICFMIRFIYISSILGADVENASVYSVILNSDYNAYTKVSGSLFLYTKIFENIAIIFGKEAITLLMLQSVIHAFITALLYYIVKIIGGKIAAFSSIIIYGFCPCIIQLSDYPSGDILLSFFFALTLFLFFYTSQKKYNGKLSKSNGIVLYALCGVLCGLSAVLDKAGLVLIIYIVILCFRVKGDFKSVIDSASVEIFISVISFVISFALFMFIGSLMHNENVLNLILDYFVSFSAIKPELTFADKGVFDYSFLLITGLSIALFIRTFKIKRDFFCEISLVPIILITFKVLGFSSSSYEFTLIFFFVILGGLGVGSLMPNTLEGYFKALEYKEKYKNGSSATQKEDPHFSLEFVDSKKKAKEIEGTLDFVKLPKQENKPNTVAATLEMNLNEIEAPKPVSEKKVINTEAKMLDAKKDENKNLNATNKTEDKKDNEMNNAEVTLDFLKDSSTVKNTNDNDETKEKEDNKPVANKEDVVSVQAIPPTQLNEAEKKPVPINKFGRRMDYKTAIVSPGPSILSKEPPVQPKIVKSGEIPVSIENKPVGKPINNPLPTPKKHVPREMNFDFEPSQAQMKFDIVDLRGKDYFDIN